MKAGFRYVYQAPLRASDANGQRPTSGVPQEIVYRDGLADRDVPMRRLLR